MSNSYSCPQCNYCDSCNNWFHVKCSGLSVQRFKELGNETSSTWFSNVCVAEALPFQKLSYRLFLSVIYAKQPHDNSSSVLNRHSPICEKRVSTIEKAAPCYQCRCYIHRNCSFLSNKQILDLIVNRQQWFCVNCGKDIFPFHSITNHDILSDSFNSHELCNNALNDFTNYECLETITELNLDKLDFSDFHTSAITMLIKM